ncbi:MAG: hypothetical protein WDZ80_02285 [Candidatus Paceibacterota bacterium]
MFDQSSKFAIPKNVACISDRDPVRRKKSGSKFTSCFPFEWGIDTENYEYSNNSDKLIKRNEEGNSIQFFAPKDIFSKTLEYDLILNNPSAEILLTESIQNRDELTDLMKLHANEKNYKDLIEKLRKGTLKEKITTTIEKQGKFTERDKCEAIIAARYLSSIAKGENALELSSNLKQNLSKKETDDFVDITLPKYIKDAIDWICK